MSNDETGIAMHRSDNAMNQGQLSATSATKRAGQFKCVGSIRKAGFLSVKKWILKRRQSIELARKQGWKRYWVCLRGTALLFHPVVDKKDLKLSDDDQQAQLKNANNYDSNQTDLASWIQTNCPNQLQTILNLLQSSSQFAQTSSSPFDQSQTMSHDNIMKTMSQCYIEKEPRHLIIIEDAIAQPIPEHPKRDYVFCLSTTFGDAYLFQSSCQSESENWISAIHNACAASIARDLTRHDAIKLFETMTRHLELEVEKKLFLRQRLESRLTSMSSMSHITDFANFHDQPDYQSTNSQTHLDENNENKEDEQNEKKLTMRSLLFRLNQQLMALDSYIEQVHCEVYQLRCYLSSCGAQHIFYQTYQNQGAPSSSGTTQTLLSTIDLPHPRSLLMHVSKPTKLLLIKLGVFTVSSFHAYIHAKQGSADTILQKIQQQSISSGPLELRMRSRSISESLLNKPDKNIKLESETEKLIYMSNLQSVKIKVKRELYFALKQTVESATKDIIHEQASDDSYSIKDEGEVIIINLKVHSSSNSISMIKQILNIIHPNLPQMNFLNYYLRFSMTKTTQNSNQNEDSVSGGKSYDNDNYYVVKRKENLSELRNFEYLELVEKIVFRVDLVRKQMDEEASPFGITIGAQLFVTESESLLNVYCSYIEWGSVADKANLKDEDEFVVINGVPVMDLDMMFIECIVQDESTLRLVVRSCRTKAPPNSVQLDKSVRDQSDDDMGGNDDVKESEHDVEKSNKNLDNISTTGLGAYLLRDATSQIISDEYISSLVCPPPPAKNAAFLRTDSTFLRQKSDLGAEAQRNAPIGFKDELISVTKPTTSPSDINVLSIPPKSKSSQNLQYYPTENYGEIGAMTKDSALRIENSLLVKGSVELASRLLEKTEQLTQLLGKNSLNSWNFDSNEKVATLIARPTSAIDQATDRPKADLNCLERLRKSILELLETEYAYIRHLETITEHYMSPLEEMSYLNIAGLKQLNQIVANLIAFQRSFFDKLIKSISTSCLYNIIKLGDNEFDDLNDIMKHLDLFKTPEEFEPILKSIAKTFLDEAEKFKVYSAYCSAYSRLQKLLHPKGAFGSYQSSSSTSVPNTLDTFLASNSFNVSTTINKSSTLQHRDFLKPLGSFISHNLNSGHDSGSQLKQLSEFLSHLDSSSSSATSISLPRSSEASVLDQANQGAENGYRRSLTNKSVIATFQKSVHQQNFESYLIKPIQRIVKYPMLLNSITVSAQAYLDKKSKIHVDLKNAVKHMESVTSHVNDTQKIDDEYGLIFLHIERQFLEHRVDQVSKQNTGNHHGPHQPAISLTVEQLLYFNEVNWLNINEFTSKVKKGMNLTQVLFVFNSCVVFICKEQVKSGSSKKKLSQPASNITNNFYSSITNSTSSQHQTNGTSLTSSTKLAFQKALNNENCNEIIRYQSVIPVSEVQVRSVPTSSDSTKTEPKDYQWELFRCSSVNSNSNLLTKSNNRNSTSGKIYLLASPTNELRNAFLRKIRFIIRESVRNMSLPIARSPSSKSLTPKKLSSPSSGDGNTNSTCSHSTSLSPVCDNGDRCKEETKDGIVNCGRFKPEVAGNNNYKTSIEVNN